MNKILFLFAFFLFFGVGLFAQSLSQDQKKELDDLVNRTYNENRPRFIKDRAALVKEINELDNSISSFHGSSKTGHRFDDNLNSQVDASELYFYKQLLNKYKALLKEYDASHPNKGNGQSGSTQSEGISSADEYEERYEANKERAREMNSAESIGSAIDMMSGNRIQKKLDDIKTSKETSQVTKSEGINKLKKKVEDKKEKDNTSTTRAERSIEDLIKLVKAGKGSQMTEKEKQRFAEYYNTLKNEYD